MFYRAQGQGLEKRCEGVWSDSPEMRSSTAVSFLLAFAGENLAPVKPVVRGAWSEGDRCVRGPKYTQAQTPAGPESKGSLLSSSATHSSLQSVGASSGPWPRKHHHPRKQHEPTGIGGWFSFGNCRCSAGSFPCQRNPTHAFLCGISTRTD